MGVMGHSTCSIILHPVSFIGRLLGAGPKILPVPQRSRVLSLPLVTMHCAQLLGIPHTPSASWLPRTNLVLFLLSQAVAETNPAAQRLPLSAIPFCARPNVYEVLQGAGPGTSSVCRLFSWGIRGLILAAAAWRKAKVKPEP